MTATQTSLLVGDLVGRPLVGKLEDWPSGRCSGVLTCRFGDLGSLSSGGVPTETRCQLATKGANLLLKVGASGNQLIAQRPQGLTGLRINSWSSSVGSRVAASCRNSRPAAGNDILDTGRLEVTIPGRVATRQQQLVWTYFGQTLQRGGSKVGTTRVSAILFLEKAVKTGEVTPRGEWHREVTESSRGKSSEG